MTKPFVILQANFRIVTPMFCGGAGQEAEFRLTSFKGALRFWWRSLQWGKVRDSEELWKKESALFGSSDQKVGRSKVQIRLIDTDTALSEKVGPGSDFPGGNCQGARYLGYGVMKVNGVLTRGMIPAGKLGVQLRCGPHLPPEQLNELKEALILLGTVGCIGSKARKGFGSLTLTQLSQADDSLPMNVSPRGRLKEILQNLKDGAPEWSAWTQRARVVEVCDEHSNAVQLLDKLGREMVHFRSWGNGGIVLGSPREGNFKADHDLSKDQPVRIKHPQRVAFGLPHNYGGHKQVRPKKLERRASPLFLHIHQMEGQKPVGVIAFLPSLFLPAGEQLVAFGKDVGLDRSDNFWAPIHGYLDRLLGKAGATKKKHEDLKAEEVQLV